MLGQQLLAQLDVLVVRLLLARSSVNYLLPLVVFGLALVYRQSTPITMPEYVFGQHMSQIGVLGV